MEICPYHRCGVPDATHHAMSKVQSLHFTKNGDVDLWKEEVKKEIKKAGYKKIDNESENPPVQRIRLTIIR
jgi:hypothetical protein